MRIKFFICLFTLIGNIYPQWVTQNNETTVSLNSIRMLSNQEGWVVGNEGTVYKLTDSGYSWQSETGLPTSENFNSLCIISNTDGWCVGTSISSSVGKIYRRNSGIWEQQFPPDTPELIAICGIPGSSSSSHLLWAVGFNGTILNSPNSGSVWSLYNYPIGTALRDVKFINQIQGWIVGNTGLIIKTDNGGFSWSDPLSSNTTNRLYGLYFADQNQGWAVGALGTIIKTTDGGDNWNIQTASTMELLYSVTGINTQNLIAVGENGTVLITSDGGNTWVAEQDLSGNFRDVAMIDTENYWIVGENGANYYSEGTIKFGADSIKTGDRFEVGETKTISFETIFNSLVDIAYNSDSSSTWITVRTNYPASNGSYEFTMPSLASSGYQIRIKSSKKSQVEAVSQKFEVYEKTINLNTPTVDTTLIGGSTFPIKWTSTNIDTVRIMFRERPDSSLKTIINNFSAISGQYNWTVETVNSNQCRILISETDGSPIDSVEFKIRFDPEAPRIFVDTSSIKPRKDSGLTVTATITDSSETVNKIYYRQGGEIVYLNKPLVQIGSSDQYQVNIDAQEGENFRIDEQGFEFYIESMDLSPDSNISYYPSDISQRPQYIPVRVDNFTYTILSSNPKNGGEGEIYQLVSMPYKLDNTDINDVLSDDFGPYDTHKWRLWFWLNDSEGYGEFTKKPIGGFTQGKSFWLATIYDRFTSGAGQSYKPADFSISLQPGWNQIGHPFAFPVSTNSIYSATLDTTGLTPMYEYNNGWPTVSVLMPDKGYFIENRTAAAKILKIPPIATVSLGKSPEVISTSGPDGWNIILKATAKKFADTYNIIGEYKDASSKWDFRDLPEPPRPVGKYITIYFPHTDWQNYPDNYTTDLRSLFTGGEIWNFIVETNIENSMIDLSFEDVKNVPDNFKVYLLDKKLSITRDLRQNPTYKYYSAASHSKKNLMLVIGNDEYLHNNVTLNETPEDYELNQNFPNPFNPSTTIHYGIPGNSLVTLSIYNILGEEVVTLIKKELKNAGYHTQVWNGLSKYGLKVPSGVYLYKLEATSIDGVSKFIQVKKMILLK